MFLTRLGFNSRMVVTGDITQIDLPTDQRSGLVVVRDILERRSRTSPSSASAARTSSATSWCSGSSPPTASTPSARRASSRRRPMTVDLSDVPAELRDAVAAALSAAGVDDGHLAVELVDAERIRELNREHRGKDAPTDVLAFPLDGAGPTAGPRELGDVAICPEHCTDVIEAAVHGVLHLCGMDDDESCDAAARCSRLAAARTRREDCRLMGLAMTRSGFVGLAGRPNVGKSTLVNAIVGSRVAIVSMRPQTTRRAIRGIATDVEAGRQLVLVDLPGVQRPRDVLTERMQQPGRARAGRLRPGPDRRQRRGGGRCRRPLHRPRPGRGRTASCRRSAPSTRSTRSGPTSWCRCSPRRPSWRASTRSSRSAPATARGSRPWSSGSASSSPRAPTSTRRRTTATSRAR